jgi:hypothetical protein
MQSAKVRFRLFFLTAMLVVAHLTAAQETYFVTYSHQMEEPGNLEIGVKSAAGSPSGGNAFIGNALEFEYGANAWWTSELYLDGQSTANESTVFTGFRWENRFRPLLSEHWINPVLYVEFENVNAADKSLLEVVGHDGRADFLERNDRGEKEREAELKLILSSNVRGWNFSENIIAEKNLANEPWEFGYAVGASRPLAFKAAARSCVLCRENFSAGTELYGGLGERYSFGLRDTSHYLATIVEWRMPSGTTFKVSPGFGLNDNSHGFLFRFGVSYEFNQIASRLRGH